MSDALIFDSAWRLMHDHADAATFAAVERGEWPAILWKPLVGAGFSDMLGDGIAAGAADALEVMRAQGRSAAPVPLLEAMLAVALGQEAADTNPALVALPQRAEQRSSEPAAVVARWPHASRTLACMPAGWALVDKPASAGLPGYAGEPQATVDVSVGVPAVHFQAYPSGTDFETLWQFSALARAAQMRGALEHMLALTVEYANTRVQFGKPLGKQQAVQHQLALMAEEVAAAAVAVDFAAAQFGSASSTSRKEAVAIAKLRAGEAAGKAAEIAHQIHGAIGFTQEYQLQRYSRRVWAWRDECGNEDDWALWLGQHVTRPDAPPLWHTITQSASPQP